MPSSIVASLNEGERWCCVVFIDPSVDVGDASAPLLLLPGGGALTRVSHFSCLQMSSIAC